MRGMRALLPLAVGAALTGCKPSIGEPIEREQARVMPWTYPVYEMTPGAGTDPGRVVSVEGRRWHAFDAPHSVYGAGYGTAIPQRMMRSIGAAGGTPLYVLASDQPPYGRLYSPLGPDRWRVYSPTSF